MSKIAASQAVGVTVESISLTYEKMFGERPKSERKRPQFERDRIVELARAGKCITAIATAMRLSRPFVRETLIAAGVKPVDGRWNRTAR